MVRVFSPRMRRYFPAKGVEATCPQLFSEHAEVFPRNGDGMPPVVTLLRACGGISIMQKGVGEEFASSPRMRRYFQTPGFPGVSSRSSPRMRRYFHPQVAEPHHRRLFSAHAEVFPCSRSITPPAPTLLRACGGISYLEEIRSVVLALLRTRGDTPCLYGSA